MLGFVAKVNCRLAWIASCFVAIVPAAAEEAHRTAANQAVEIAFTSQKAYADPFNQAELDVLFTEPGGRQLRVPAFWAGGTTWRVRYASAALGVHGYRTECSDRANAGLHGIEGKVEVTAYQGDNPLYRHGPIRVAADRRHFEHADGTPFLWLGDTWWMGLCRRLHWPDDFQALAADRRHKGFNVVQIVAGLYPDMGAFDERGRGDAGFPWQRDYSRINPEYFDAADQRLAWLVDQGLSPCIVGAWGYHLPWLGIERMKKHWRYLAARYGAWPVLWCVAGEGTMPYYLTTKRQQDEQMQKRGWTEVARYLRQIDPFHRPITIHPSASARDTVDDVAVLDFDMLQTGHGDRGSIPSTLGLIRRSGQAQPPMPTVVGEVCYEGILETCFAEVQRFMVWSSYLSGSAGHTYGANGIWQVNRPGEPYGASPHGGNWGNRPWNEAARMPGSRQVGLAKQFLMELPWQQFQPHPEWASYPSLSDQAESAAPWGDWIWYPEGNPAKDAPVQTRYFRRAFTIPEGKAIQRAVLRISADDRATAYLNGTTLGSHTDWQTGRTFRGLARHLKPGQNVLAVAATNAPAGVPQNPAGLIAVLAIDFADGSKLLVPSDATWRASRSGPTGWQAIDFRDRNWPMATLAARYGEGPWGKINERQDQFMVPYPAGIAGRVRVIYLPLGNAVVVNKLEPGVNYQAAWFDPVDGHRVELGPVASDARGTWNSPEPPRSDSDWVLVLQRR